MILAVDWDGEFARLLLAEPQKEIVRVNKLLRLSREELVDFLSKEKGRLDIRVCGGIEGSVHKTVLLPPLKKKLIKESIEKETQKIFEEKSEYSYEEMCKVEDATVGIQTEIFVMGLGRKFLEEMSSLFSNYKAKSTLFTSYSIAVRTLLEELGELKEKQTVAFADVSGKRSRILIFKGKDIRITRGLPLGAEEGVGSTDRIVRDIRQTILFYTENYPQDKIEKIVLGGSFKPSEFLDSLKKQVDLKLVPLWAEDIFQGSNEELLTYPGCLGLVLLNPRKFNFSLVPKSVKEKKKNKKLAAIIVSAFIGVILLILVANIKYSLDWLRLLDNERSIQGEIKKRESELKELAPELISNSVEKQPSWAEFLVELAGVVPEDIKIKTLTVKKAGKKWKGELTGLIPGYDKVDGFYRAEELRILFNQSSTWINPILERKLDGENLKFKFNLMLKG